MFDYCKYMYNYILVRTKSPLGWLNLPHSPTLPPPVTAKQRVVIIPGDESDQGTDGYEGKEFEKIENIQPAQNILVLICQPCG